MQRREPPGPHERIGRRPRLQQLLDADGPTEQRGLGQRRQAPGVLSFQRGALRSAPAPPERFQQGIHGVGVAPTCRQVQARVLAPVDSVQVTAAFREEQPDDVGESGLGGVV